MPHIFIPQMVEMQRSGRFPLEKLCTTYSYGDLKQAIVDMLAGKVSETLCVNTWAKAEHSRSSSRFFSGRDRRIHGYRRLTSVVIPNVYAMMVCHAHLSCSTHETLDRRLYRAAYPPARINVSDRLDKTGQDCVLLTQHGHCWRVYTLTGNRTLEYRRFHKSCRIEKVLQ